MRCRSIQAADVELLSTWNRQLQVDEGATVMELGAIAARLRRWLADGYEGVVFEIDSTPVGYALFRATDPDLKGPDGLYLRQFFVAPRHRRRGVGTAAFRALVAQVGGGRRLVLEVLDSNAEGLSFSPTSAATRTPSTCTST